VRRVGVGSRPVTETCDQRTGEIRHVWWTRVERADDDASHRYPSVSRGDVVLTYDYVGMMVREVQRSGRQSQWAGGRATRLDGIPDQLVGQEHRVARSRW